MEICTFTPLSRNRFRCNQVHKGKHKILKKGQINSYRRWRLNKGRKPPLPLQKPPPQRVASIGEWDTAADCVSCTKSYFVGLNEKTATIHCDCGITLLVRRAKSCW